MLSRRVTDDTHRLRSASALFAGVAVSSMGYTMLVAVIPLVAEDILGSPRWSGLPSALSTMGTAFGATWLTRIMARRGRRRGLTLGYVGAGACALLAALAAVEATFAVLALAIFGIGAGYAASRLSRYAAADLYEPERRSAAIGWNVWAATSGAVLGPLLLSSVQSAGDSIRIPRPMAPFLVAGLAFAGAGVLLRVLFPAAIGPFVASVAHAEEGAHRRGTLSLLPLSSLVLGQVVMVLIMTMTPIHIRNGGHDLHAVGTVIASHTFGMYAFSPVSGFLSGRLGRAPMIGIAAVLLSLSGVLSANAETGSPALALALFLLGLGWNFSFVAGSALLTEGASGRERLRVEGLADALVWGSSALAAAGSGVVLAEVGYSTLSHGGAALALLPLLFMRRHGKERKRV
jgi:MFS family permease